MSPPSIQFGPYTLDLQKGILLRKGEPLTVAQSGILILTALLEANGGVVTKEHLLESGWPGVIVEEANLTVQIGKLRALLGSGADGREWIVTVPRVGYRLLNQANDAPPVATGKPSIAVLPFANLSGDQEQDYQADGLVDDLITGLSRFHTFAVVARSSTFAYRGRAVDSREAARELGVRYLLEGSIRRSADRIRINARLVEGTTGVHIWAEQFDGTVTSLFDFQDDITQSVIALIEPQIRKAEIERVRQKRPDSLDAWDLYVQAVPLVHAANVPDYDIAVGLLDRAVELDPHYAPGLAFASWAHEKRRTFGGTAPPGVDDVAIALNMARRAVGIDPNDAFALGLLGWERILFEADAAGLELCERAVTLNPHNRAVLDLAAVAELWVGDLDKVIAYASRAITLSPGAPDSYACVNHIALAHFQARRFEDAALWARRSIDLEKGYFYSRLTLAVTLAQLGSLDEAKQEMSVARVIWPEFKPAAAPQGLQAAERWEQWDQTLGKIMALPV